MVWFVYDCEIAKAIPLDREPMVPGIEYCKGWRDFKGMGLAVLCTVDDRGHAFVQTDPEIRFQTYGFGVPVSFNGIRFDNPLLRANYHEVNDGPCYDILREIWIGKGLNPDEFIPNLHGGLGLNAMCEANKVGVKIGRGAISPIMWQRGKRLEVISYCLHDCYLTAMLFERILTVGYLYCPKTGDKINMRIPSEPI